MKEATLWLALDDVTEENGAMDMFTFSAVPESRGQDLPKIQLAEEVSTEFFIKMDPAALAALPTEKAFKMELKRGQVPSANTKIYILPKFKHMPIFIIVDRLSSTMPSSYITAIPTNRRTNEDVPLLRGTSLTT